MGWINEKVMARAIFGRTRHVKQQVVTSARTCLFDTCLFNLPLSFLLCDIVGDFLRFGRFNLLSLGRRLSDGRIGLRPTVISVIVLILGS